MKSLSSLVPHRTILQSPKVQGTTGQWEPDPPETVHAGSALPTLCLPHAGQQGSSPADVVLPFLGLPQATVATEATPGA